MVLEGLADFAKELELDALEEVVGQGGEAGTLLYQLVDVASRLAPVDDFVEQVAEHLNLGDELEVGVLGHVARGGVD
jgi:hypothetical protein